MELSGAKVEMSAEELARIKREEDRRLRREQARRLWGVTILLAGVAAFFFILSCFPTISKAWAWLRPLSEIAGACDGIAFFGLMYLQLANNQVDLLEPMMDTTEENRRLLLQLERESGKLTEIHQELGGIRHQELGGIRQQLVHVSNTRWLASSGAFMGRFSIDLNSAIGSEPPHPKMVLRLMRLSGHWSMNEMLKRPEELLEKLFYTGNSSGQWADQWEVKILYAVWNKESLDALLDARCILGKVISDRPRNYTFRLIARQKFEPSIGLGIIDDEIAFVSFDENIDDPFPEQGLLIHGDAVEWYIKWFDEMFESSAL